MSKGLESLQYLSNPTRETKAKVEEQCIEDYEEWAGRIVETKILYCNRSDSHSLTLDADPPLKVKILKEQDPQKIISWAEYEFSDWCVPFWQVELIDPPDDLPDIYDPEIAAPQRSLLGEFESVTDWEEVQEISLKGIFNNGKVR